MVCMQRCPMQSPGMSQTRQEVPLRCPAQGCSHVPRSQYPVVSQTVCAPAKACRHWVPLQVSTVHGLPSSQRVHPPWAMVSTSSNSTTSGEVTHAEVKNRHRVKSRRFMLFVSCRKKKVGSSGSPVRTITDKYPETSRPRRPGTCGRTSEIPARCTPRSIRPDSSARHHRMPCTACPRGCSNCPPGNSRACRNCRHCTTHSAPPSVPQCCGFDATQTPR